MTATSPLDNAQSITVMGLGRFGGGVGVVRFLCQQEKRVLLTDVEPAERLAESLGQIDDLVQSGQVTLRLGGHEERDFTETDLVIANPAVPKPWANRFLQAAERAGVPITTEIRLLVERLPRRDHVIGITGTAGKSTTSAMIAHALRVLIAEAGKPNKVWLGGNIGGSLLNDVQNIGADDLVVLELSSAQLYWLGPGVGCKGAPRWAPKWRVLTNCKPNHLDWHGTFEHYQQCKLNIALPADKVFCEITGRDEQMKAMTQLKRDLGFEPDTNYFFDQWGELFAGGGPEILGMSKDDLDDHNAVDWHDESGTIGRDGLVVMDEWFEKCDGLNNLRIPGAHNRLNALLAMEAVFWGLCVIGTGPPGPERTWRPHIARALATFPGLPHRLQLVQEYNGIRAYNDSKCTTPEAAALAIAAFEDPERIRLICGGYDKKIDLSPMIAPAATCASVYTIGTTGPTIDNLVGAAGGKSFACETLDVAVKRACADAKSGDVILLSPGCASWDQFRNYEERGEAFARLVGPLLGHSVVERLGVAKGGGHVGP